MTRDQEIVQADLARIVGLSAESGQAMIEGYRRLAALLDACAAMYRHLAGEDEDTTPEELR